MLNKVLNVLAGMPIKSGLKKYQSFPADQTALLLINCQKGFLTGRSDLTNQLENLLHFARQKNWKIIHAPFSDAERKFPSPGHLLMDQKLKESSTNQDLFYVEEGDITLPPRSSLSAFSETDLENTLRQQGLEHVVLAGPMAELTLDSTMRDGVQQDFHIAVLTDVLALVDPSHRVRDYQSTLDKYAQTVTDLKGLKKLS